MADDLGERTEDPTERKIQQARLKGQVAKSTDLTSVVGLFGSLVSIALIATWAGRFAMDIMRRSFNDGFAGDPISLDGVMPMIRQAAQHSVWLILPVMGISALVAIIANAAQSMPIFSLQPIQPKLSKLNPIEGFKRVFGVKGLVRTSMSLAKLTAALAVASLLTSMKFERIVELPGLPIPQIVLVGARLVLETVLWILFFLLVIAFADFMYQKWQHKKDLRMSKHEVKDERKSMDGDPEIKRRRMKMMMEAAQQRVGTAVPQADVVVTNPTHFSVAIKYDPEWAAPRVTAKGGDHLAFRIRALAVTSGVPIVERPPLARALYWNTEVGTEIAPEQYEAVAEVLAYVYRLDSELETSTRSAIESRKAARPAQAGVGGDA